MSLQLVVAITVIVVGVIVGLVGFVLDRSADPS
jgi:hypothetical protein